MAVHRLHSVCYMRYKLYKVSSLQSVLIAETIQPVFIISVLHVKINTDKVQSK